MVVLSKRSVIIDTSFFIALADSKDSHHAQAEKLAKTYVKNEWITTWPILTELAYILSSYSFLKLLEEHQKGLFTILSFKDDHVRRIMELKKRYNDHDIDLTDISLIILAEHLEHGSILTFDMKDFSFLKWNNTRLFENLSQR